MRVVVDTHRNAHLGSYNHVDGRLVTLEYLEHLAQETRGKQHATRLYLNGRYLVFGGDGLYLVVQNLVVDDGSLGIWVQGILQSHGDACILGRLHACGVQYLRAKVGQLGSLFKVQLPNGLGLIYHTWVVVVHAVDVCPNLNFIGRQYCAH